MSASSSRRDVLRMAGGVTVLLAGGCASLLTTAPPRLFSLKLPASSLPSPSGAPPAWSLAVALPEMSQALDTDRVALKRGSFELDYFADAAWADRLPGLVQGLLINSFENSGQIAAVFKDTLNVHSDFLLLTQVTDFEAQYPASGTAPPQIQIRIVSQIAHSADRTILATLEAHGESGATENRLEAIVPAFDQAAADVVAQITAWATGLAARSSKPVSP